MGDSRRTPAEAGLCNWRLHDWGLCGWPLNAGFVLVRSVDDGVDVAHLSA